MLCANGAKMRPKNSNCMYFICNLDENKGNSCRFAKWCERINDYTMQTDASGKACKNYQIKVVEGGE